MTLQCPIGSILGIEYSGLTALLTIRETVEKIFQERILAFNENLAMASFGTSKGHGIITGSGPPSFYLSGMVSHRIGTLAPAPANDPVFAQILFRLRPNALKHGEDSTDRLKKYDVWTQHINRLFLYVLDGMLRHHNRRVKLFLSTRVHGQTYNLPTQDEVAVILPGEAPPSFSLLLFTPYPSHLIPSPLMKEASTQTSYNVADGKRTALSVDDVDRLAAMYAKQRTTVSSLKADGHDIVKLPEGNYGHAVLAHDTAQVVVTMLGKIVSIDRSLNRDASRVPQRCGHKFSQEMAAACSIATNLTIPFNTSSLNVNPRVDFLHHQLVTLHAHWTEVTGGDPIPEKGGHPPWPAWKNDIDANKYHMFYNNAREGSCNGRKVAKYYVTPLPVNGDGHAELYANTILRVGDVCAVMCSVQTNAWKSKATGKYSGRIDFVPLRIRVHGTLNVSLHCHRYR
ncbi:BZ3500_MvSof-1268-A1-R1_Chr6-3g08840 [Microbotryum saponariae]|uniref:BZ3500_MvSof-1268-A1-R1_Chr6-3g08840 protein n=1 Tax=Microbotryum saponariae TaxID=289078 RepID=A0A2X0KLM0_9BASI|nr:BZ3500_MvSof-1268-A1-R1_Chr6-3g08840 [Microbotryum saponariae]SDA07441.1 BZ3501_MvSof-1269-A2-R1_Chr6-2g08543 [Microbotryum saponariae]